MGNPKLYPQVLSVKKITFCGDFSVSEPYVKLINNSTKEIIYNTHEIENVLELEKSKKHSIKFNKKHCFVGDVTL